MKAVLVKWNYQTAKQHVGRVLMKRRKYDRAYDMIESTANASILQTPHNQARSFWTFDLTCLVREIHEELFEELSAEELTHMQTVLGQNNDAYTRPNSAWQDAYIETITRIGGAPFECDDFSLSAKCLTHYIFHIYQVKLQANVPIFQYDSCVPHPEHSSVINEWGSAGDIKHGLTAQGRPIGKTVKQILMWTQAQERSL